MQVMSCLRRRPFRDILDSPLHFSLISQCICLIHLRKTSTRPVQSPKSFSPSGGSSSLRPLGLGASMQTPSLRHLLVRAQDGFALVYRLGRRCKWRAHRNGNTRTISVCCGFLSERTSSSLMFGCSVVRGCECCRKLPFAAAYLLLKIILDKNDPSCTLIPN